VKEGGNEGGEIEGGERDILYRSRRRGRAGKSYRGRDGMRDKGRDVKRK
jgi:hypothetical protein